MIEKADEPGKRNHVICMHAVANDTYLFVPVCI